MASEAHADKSPRIGNDENVQSSREENWDRFQEGTDIRWDQPLCEKLEGYVKLPFTIFLFLFVVGCGVLSRSTLHIMIWQLQPPSRNQTSRLSSMGGLLMFNWDKYRDNDCFKDTESVDEKWIWALFLVIITPLIFGVFASMRKICCTNTSDDNLEGQVPDKTTTSEEQEDRHKASTTGENTSFLCIKVVFFVFLFEMLDTVGVCLMTFVVLPQFDPSTASVLYLYAGFFFVIPDLISEMCQSENTRENSNTNNSAIDTNTKRLKTLQTCLVAHKRLINITLSLLGLVSRFLGVVFIGLYIRDTLKIVIFVVAVFLATLRYHENFFYVLLKGCQIPTYIEEHRPCLVLCSNILKILTCFLSVISVTASKSTDSLAGTEALFGDGIANFSNTYFGLQFGTDSSCSSHIPFVIAVLNIISSLLFYKAAKSACVICCQIIGFAFPSVLVVPTLTLCVLLSLMRSPEALQFDSCNLMFAQWSIESTSAAQFKAWWKIILAFVLAVLTNICLYRYIFSTIGIKQAKTARLLFLPYYCGVFIDLSMIMNRRKNDRTPESSIEETVKETQSKEIEHDTNNSKVDDTSQKPMIYACATMWHEERYEMIQLLVSIMRMDRDHFDLNKFFSEYKEKQKKEQDQAHDRRSFNISTDTTYLPSQEVKKSQSYHQKKHSEYDFEVHIFFDDAFEKPRKTNQRGNDMSKDSNGMSMKGGNIQRKTKKSVEFVIPPSNQTDSKETRDASTSQNDMEPTVNGYVRMFLECIEEATSKFYHQWETVKSKFTCKTPYGGRIVCQLPLGTKVVIHLKNKMKIRARKRWSQVMYMYYLLGHLANVKGERRGKEEKTFILALDGDVDFKPQAVKHLLNRMKKDPNVGAACGRIHPVGSGLMVWYQKFEYAISHWLQKSTEHVCGCVLCSPGCFTLFRGSALMDKNVMKTYTTPPTQARHHVQYDQGEDRWLCTLLLKQGYRVEYNAESDAFTYAPENFFDFWKQRRRWTPSTMANILEILTDSKTMRRRNRNISYLYIAYQVFLFISSVLTPGTTFLLIVGAILTGFPSISSLMALFLNIIPVGLFILTCMFAKESTQLFFGAILSAVYAIVMLIVLMGLLKTSIEEGFCSSTTVILCFVTTVFVVSAVLHPKEGSCLFHGLLFFIAIPSMSMLMFLYSVANLNNVTWGTREKANPKKNEKSESEGSSHLKSVKIFFRRCFSQRSDDYKPEDEENHTDTKQSGNPQDDKLAKKYDLSFTKKLSVETQEKEEFWNELINKYLQPTELSNKEKFEQKQELLNLRNRVCVIVFLSNTILVVLIFALTQVEAFRTSLVAKLKCGDRSVTIEPLSVLFTLSFGILMLIQFVCMIYHRFSTLLHITSEQGFCGVDTTEDDVKKILIDMDNVKNDHSATQKSESISENIISGIKRSSNGNSKGETQRAKSARNFVREHTHLHKS